MNYQCFISISSSFFFCLRCSKIYKIDILQPVYQQVAVKHGQVGHMVFIVVVVVVVVVVSINL